MWRARSRSTCPITTTVLPTRWAFTASSRAPYLYLPLLGPTTIRDIIGAGGDYFAQPRLLGLIFEPSSKKSIFARRLTFGNIQPRSPS
jgi:hypothetical protein